MRVVEPSPPVVGLSSNVLEFGDSLVRPDGIGTYTQALESALNARGVTVRRVGAPMRAGGRFLSPKGAHVSFPVPTPYLAAAAMLLRFDLPFVERVERTIDIYHATDYLVPRFTRTPVVTTLYDAIPLSHPEWANPRLRALKNRLLVDCARRADRVIAISNSVVPDLVDRYRVAPDRIRVVRLGVAPDWFVRPSDAEIAAALAVHGITPGYFLHVGTLQPRKNLDRLVTAYGMLPQAIRKRRQLVLVGKYGWSAQAFRRRLEALRTDGRVVWLDYVSHDALHCLYYGAGTFVFPSLSEGFGLPILEALAAGLPVIASDLQVLREIANDHAWFVSPLDTTALAATMQDAEQFPNAASDVQLRRSHASTFNWEDCAARTLAVYREAL